MDDPLTDMQIREFSQRLKKRRTELVEEIREELLNSKHDHHVDLANHIHDIGDDSVADLLSDIDLALIDQHVHELQDVQAALQRIDAGEFAVCINCGGAIDYKRLDAYPTAKRCYTCQMHYGQKQAKPRHASL